MKASKNFTYRTMCKSFSSLIAIFIILLMVSCQSNDPEEMPMETDPDPDPNPVEMHDQFSFILDNDQLEWVYESRDTTYEITDPTPSLKFNQEDVEVKKMKVRGTSASRVRRKSFNVDTEEFMSFTDSYNMTSAESKDFRLLAMSSDFCYIENRVGFGLLQEADLFPLFFKYVEVKLNEETNGTYLLIENPNDYFLDKNGHAILIRRYYYGNIDSYKYESNGDGFSEQDYVKAYNDIYDIIKDFDGQELYEELDKVLNVRQYMRLMAFNYLIKNGDYTDEIYLYDIPGDNDIRLNALSWDLDDIFAELPHEIGSSWSVGNRFGDRYYDSVDDVIEDVGEKLIFSIEDDLDYKIAKDPYLYSIYLEELEQLMNRITEVDIRNEFEEVESSLKSFFADTKIVDQTIHDDDQCDLETLEAELMEKMNFLIERRQEILDKL